MRNCLCFWVELTWTGKYIVWSQFGCWGGQKTTTCRRCDDKYDKENWPNVEFGV